MAHASHLFALQNILENIHTIVVLIIFFGFRQLRLTWLTLCVAFLDVVEEFIQFRKTTLLYSVQYTVYARRPWDKVVDKDSKYGINSIKSPCVHRLPLW